MHLLSLSSATVLGLMTFTHLVVEATSDSSNQVNVYSDDDCGKSNDNSYETTWDGPGGEARSITIKPPQYVGSVIIMSDNKNFDSLDVNSVSIHLGNTANCPAPDRDPVWTDINGNACYPVNMTVHSVYMYIQPCNEVGDR